MRRYNLSTSANPDALAYAAGFRRIAGVDEAGRGPWAGPVVASAVTLRTKPLPPHQLSDPHPRRDPSRSSSRGHERTIGPNRPSWWGGLPVRIDDSKRLTSTQRQAAFEIICQSADIGIGIVCADEIDQRNILEATLLAMRQAIAGLSCEPELILVDGSCAPSLEIPCWPIVRGDQRSYAISCASIVAKVTRDRLMAFYHELDPRYHFNRHKGYGTSLHARALRALGPSALHRLTFQPVAACTVPAVGTMQIDSSFPPHEDAHEVVAAA